MKGIELSAGQIWRRKSSGTVVRIICLENTAVGTGTPFFDITWETVEKPFRRGDCFENYWLRGYELVSR